MKQSDDHEFLNYHHLRYFWTVAKEGSLKRASEKLKVSQPAMSTQIQQLGAALGGDLFRPSGRTMVMTEFGQMIYGYAEDIFTLGGEILRATKQGPSTRSLRLNVGIVDSFPKIISYNILRPVFEHQPPVKLTCHEGKIADLVSQLNTHRLDIVLADEPASPGISGRVFNHPLGSSDITFFATPALAKSLKGKFPQNLDKAPALLPTQNCSLRRDLEKWFGIQEIKPRVIAEFEDGALAKIVASHGLGFMAIPTVMAEETIQRYGFVSLGRTKEVLTEFYAITAERRFIHPAIVAIAKRKHT